MSNPTPSTVPALLQPHLKAFLPLLNKETLIDVVLGMNLELTNEKANVATLTQQVTALTDGLNATVKELDARTAEFEEKYYGLDLENRRLRKTIELRGERIKHLEERFAVVTMRLAQAEAALGVFCPEGLDEPCNDEWDALSDEALRNA